MPEALMLIKSQTTYVMQAFLSAPHIQSPTKKDFKPADKWEMQHLYLCRLYNTSRLKYLPNIFRKMAPLHKDKARFALKITCQHKARGVLYKSPRISHVVAGLLIILMFHTKKPDGVGDTVNIFLFPNPSLSAGSKAALLVKGWDTLLDISILNTYVNTT